MVKTHTHLDLLWVRSGLCSAVRPPRTAKSVFKMLSFYFTPSFHEVTEKKKTICSPDGSERILFFGGEYSCILRGAKKGEKEPTGKRATKVKLITYRRTPFFFGGNMPLLEQLNVVGGGGGGGWGRGGGVFCALLQKKRDYLHTKTKFGLKYASRNGGRIVMRVGIRKIHQNTSQYTMYCDVFCVFRWAPITILPPLASRGSTPSTRNKVALKYKALS